MKPHKPVGVKRQEKMRSDVSFTIFLTQGLQEFRGRTPKLSR